MNKYDKLYKEIDEYCQYNSIEDIDEFRFTMLKKGFMMEKYGIFPRLYEKKENAATEEKSNPSSITAEPVLSVTSTTDASIIKAKESNSDDDYETEIKVEKKNSKKRILK